MKNVLLWFGVVASAVGAGAAAPGQRLVGTAENAEHVPQTSRAFALPRKVVLASVLADIHGSLQDRVESIGKLTEEAAKTAQHDHQDHKLDLVIFPEFAVCNENGRTAAERAVSVTGPEFTTIAAMARAHRVWMIVPMTLRESAERISNAAVLLDREGRVAGIYRKVHPVVDDHGVFEGGVTPGGQYPVFDTDFGKIGILICWDMVYEEAWDALAKSGAEIVALPSASPQNVRPMMQSLRHHYYVANSAPRDNATVFNPVGQIAGQIDHAPGVLVRQIDLSFAILHWSDHLENGRGLSDRYGKKVGYAYSTREDTGVFWSNDPTTSIGAMIKEVGLREMPEVIEEVERARRARVAQPD